MKSNEKSTNLDKSQGAGADQHRPFFLLIAKGFASPRVPIVLGKEGIPISQTRVAGIRQNCAHQKKQRHVV